MELRKDFKSSEVGKIPSDWKLMALVDLAEIRSGIAKNSNAAIANPVFVHYLRVANVQDGFLDLTEMSQLQVSREDIKRYAVLPGDMLMNEGGDLDKLGRGALWSGEFSPCVHQNHVFVVRCGSSLLPTYLKAWTGSTAARKYFLLAGRQTTNLASINKTSLGLLPVPLPPSQTEQEAIAEALSDADALIESLDKLIIKKRQIKQGAMQELLTGKRRLPEFSREWEVKRLGDFGSTYGGLTGKTKADFGEGSSRYITFMNVMANVVIDCDIFEPVNVSSTESQNRAAKGDLFFNGSSETPEEVGLCSVLANSVADVYLNSFCFGFRFREGAKANGLYFAYFFRSLEGRELLKSLAQGATRYNLSKTALLKVAFPLPSLEEQTAIATVLSDMDTELAALESRLAKARQIKQGMMQELLTGRIRLL